jgi:enamine deaminase RidA (YjgF/YER057c/UK114 family)
MSGIEARLSELRILLPPPLVMPGANRVSAVEIDGLLYVSGHGAALLDDDSVRRRGKVDTEVSEAEAYAIARSLAIKMLATVKSHAGSLDAVRRVVKIVGFVNCHADYERANKVINGASDLFYEVFGPHIGRHARSSIGVASLVDRQPVEIEGVFHIGHS